LGPPWSPARAQPVPCSQWLGLSGGWSGAWLGHLAGVAVSPRASCALRLPRAQRPPGRRLLGWVGPPGLRRTAPARLRRCGPQLVGRCSLTLRVCWQAGLSERGLVVRVQPFVSLPPHLSFLVGPGGGAFFGLSSYCQLGSRAPFCPLSHALLPSCLGPWVSARGLLAALARAALLSCLVLPFRFLPFCFPLDCTEVLDGSFILGGFLVTGLGPAPPLSSVGARALLPPGAGAASALAPLRQLLHGAALRLHPSFAAVSCFAILLAHRSRAGCLLLRSLFAVGLVLALWCRRSGCVVSVGIRFGSIASLGADSRTVCFEPGYCSDATSSGLSASGCLPPAALRLPGPSWVFTLGLFLPCLALFCLRFLSFVCHFLPNFFPLHPFFASPVMPPACASCRRVLR